MPEPPTSKFNMFESNKEPYAYQANSYKSYDQTTGKVLNCYYPQKGPMEIALSGSYTVANNLTEEQYQNLARGGCVLSNFPSATYPELYDSFNKEFAIFQKLYINNITGLLNSANLVPSYSGNTVNCSSAGDAYIPYVLEYEMNRDYKRYARFCATQAQINQLQFTTIGDYSVYNYIDNNTKLACQSNNCSTQYPSFVGHNLNTSPVISSTPDDHKQSTTLIIVFVISGVILLILIIFTVVYLREHKKFMTNANKKLFEKKEKIPIVVSRKTDPNAIGSYKRLEDIKGFYITT